METMHGSSVLRMRFEGLGDDIDMRTEEYWQGVLKPRANGIREYAVNTGKIARIPNEIRRELVVLTDKGDPLKTLLAGQINAGERCQKVQFSLPSFLTITWRSRFSVLSGTAIDFFRDWFRSQKDLFFLLFLV
jgi:hypothetical protein